YGDGNVEVVMPSEHDAGRECLPRHGGNTRLRMQAPLSCSTNHEGLCAPSEAGTPPRMWRSGRRRWRSVALLWWRWQPGRAGCHTLSVMAAAIGEARAPACRAVHGSASLPWSMPDEALIQRLCDGWTPSPW